MISYIYLKNFKAFQEAEIAPASLNIFAGLNGMGKSSFLQALLLLRQSYLQNTLLDKGLLLNGNHPEHVAQHTAFFEENRRKSLQKSKDLWDRRNEFFPSLILCGEVEKQLTKLGIQSQYFDQIIERLKRLDSYARNWNEGAYSDARVKQCGLNVSGESSSTLSKYGRFRKFKLPHGERKLFEKHIKTGDLRFHFYPENETKRIYVGYIGKHLPICSQD